VIVEYRLPAPYKDFVKGLDINLSSYANYNTCISYCLPYAFGEYNLNYSDICENCKSLFLFFDTLQKNLENDKQEKLLDYQN
jgi:hypothetical protein